MPRGTMNIAPLLCIDRATERPLLFLICRLLLMIPVTFVISATTMMIGRVDLPIILLLLCGPLAT
jgi:hypothetical protein